MGRYEKEIESRERSHLRNRADHGAVARTAAFDGDPAVSGASARCEGGRRHPERLDREQVSTRRGAGPRPREGRAGGGRWLGEEPGGGRDGAVAGPASSRPRSGGDRRRSQGRAGHGGTGGTEMRPSGGRDPRLRSPEGAAGQRQLSLIVVAPPEPVVDDRFGSDSQVTDPSGFFLRYLYWNAVFGGSGTVADHVG